MINSAGPATGRSWYRFSTASTDDDEEEYTDLYIHDEIGGWGVYSTDLIRDLMMVDSDRIRVRINSPGGDVFEGLAIHNALMTHPATINTYVDGLAASAASFIFQAGEERVVSKYGSVMIHNPNVAVWGESKDLRKMADLLDKLRDQVASIYSDRSGDDLQGFIDLMDAETWFNSAEAVEFKLADRVDDTNTKYEAPSDSWDLSVYMHAGRSQAPAPARRRSQTDPVPTNCVVIPAANTQPDVPLAPEPKVEVPAAADFASLFQAAMSFAATPPVPTDQAPFEFDADVFKAILADSTKTAPAVVSQTRTPDPATFATAYDPELVRRAVIERM